VDGNGVSGDILTVTGTLSLTPTIRGVGGAAVDGAAGNDTIVVSPVSNSGMVVVALNGKSIGIYAMIAKPERKRPMTG
jgi:hypothetical protein